MAANNAVLDEITATVKQLAATNEGKILIVGAKGANFPQDYWDHERVIIWNSQDGIGSATAIPEGVKMVLLTRFVPHKMVNRIKSLLPRGVTLVNFTLETGKIKTFLKPLVSPDDHQPSGAVIEDPEKALDLVYSSSKKVLVIGDSILDVPAKFRTPRMIFWPLHGIHASSLKPIPQDVSAIIIDAHVSKKIVLAIKRAILATGRGIALLDVVRGEKLTKILGGTKPLVMQPTPVVETLQVEVPKPVEPPALSEPPVSPEPPVKSRLIALPQKTAPRGSIMVLVRQHGDLTSSEPKAEARRLLQIAQEEGLKTSADSIYQVILKLRKPMKAAGPVVFTPQELQKMEIDRAAALNLPPPLPSPAPPQEAPPVDVPVALLEPPMKITSVDRLVEMKSILEIALVELEAAITEITALGAENARLRKLAEIGLASLTRKGVVNGVGG